MSTADILEQNLERLFERSYVAVEPADEFRRRLASAAEAEVASSRRVRGNAFPNHLLRQPFRQRRLAIAALLLALIGLALTLFLSRGSRAKSLDELLASGAVAVREHGSTSILGAWRALDGSELLRGLDIGLRGIEATTPLVATARLWLGSDGRVDGAPDTRFTISERANDGSRTFSIKHGALRVERYSTGAAWTIEGAPLQNGADLEFGRVELERGVLSARIEDASANGGTGGTCLVVELLDGVGSALVDGARSPLARGTRLALQGSHVLAARAEIEQPFDWNGRTSSAPESTPPGAPAKPASRPDDRVAVSGTLRTASDLELPKHYTVTVLRHERLPAVSFPQSRPFEAAPAFTLDGLKPGTYDVYVEARGFALWRAPDVDLAAGASRALDVVLEKARVLRGRVVDAESGAPIEGAVVISEDDVPAQVLPFALDAASLPWNAATVSGPDGAFEIAGLSGGATVLRASCAGHGAAWSEPLASVSAGDRSTGGADPKQIRIALPRPGTLRGRVAQEDGAPWGGAIVIASFAQSTQRFARMSFGMAVAEADGAYEIQDLPAGSYVVLNPMAAHGGSSGAATGVREVLVVAGKTTIANLPEGGARLHGVLLANDGHPLDGMDVTLKRRESVGPRGWQSQRSRDGGNWSFDGIAPGVYELFVGTSLGTSFCWQEEIEVPAVPDLHHDLRLGAGSIRGVARERAPSTPGAPGEAGAAGANTAAPGTQAAHGSIATAFVLLEMQRDGVFAFAGKTATDGEGRFAFEGLTLGTYRVTIYPLREPLAPATSEELWLTPALPAARGDVAIDRGAVLDIRVVDASGAPVAGVGVRFVDASNGRALQLTNEDATDAHGVLHVPGIAAGRWKISAALEARASAPSTVDLLVGEQREIVLKLAP